MMERIYLSRKNLQTLLNKLNRAAEGGSTMCSIIKSDNIHPVYPQTMDEVLITAVEDDEYYSHRSPGFIHVLDDPSKELQ